MREKNVKSEPLTGHHVELANLQIDEFSGTHTPKEKRAWDKEAKRISKKKKNKK